MKHLKIGIIGMIFMAMLFSVNAFAQKGNNRGMQSRYTFADFDSDKDGVITKIEYTKARDKRVSEREKTARRTNTKKDVITFESIDTNSDGKITKTEFADHQTKRKNNKRK